MADAVYSCVWMRMHVGLGGTRRMCRGPDRLSLRSESGHTDPTARSVSLGVGRVDAVSNYGWVGLLRIGGGACFGRWGLTGC